jgi:hypothetical protein
MLRAFGGFGGWFHAVASYDLEVKLLGTLVPVNYFRD